MHLTRHCRLLLLIRQHLLVVSFLVNFTLLIEIALLFNELLVSQVDFALSRHFFRVNISPMFLLLPTLLLEKFITTWIGSFWSARVVHGNVALGITMIIGVVPPTQTIKRVGPGHECRRRRALIGELMR